MEKKKYPYNLTLPLYRHKWLYEWSDKYQEHKFFTDKDYADYIRLEGLKYKGQEDYIEFSGDEDMAHCEPCEFRYSERYGSLKQNTVFFRNLCKIGDIRWFSAGYSDFILKCIATGISERKANFELLYHFFNPGRIFCYNYKEWSPEMIAERVEFWSHSPDDIGMRHDYEQWCKFEEMRKEAFSGKRHNCATYEEFIETEL